jgi:hypothetical protein
MQKTPYQSLIRKMMALLPNIRRTSDANNEVPDVEILSVSALSHRRRLR